MFKQYKKHLLDSYDEYQVAMEKYIDLDNKSDLTNFERYELWNAEAKKDKLKIHPWDVFEGYYCCAIAECRDPKTRFAYAYIFIAMKSMVIAINSESILGQPLEDMYGIDNFFYICKKIKFLTILRHMFSGKKNKYRYERMRAIYLKSIKEKRDENTN